MQHASTREQRSQWVAQMLVAEKQDGLISELSRQHQVSRKTLYVWKEKAERAIQEALGRGKEVVGAERQIERKILTMFVEGHSSYRGIQTCIEELCGEKVCLEKIGHIINEVGERARKLLEYQKPIRKCAIAVDEQYSNEHGKAY